MSNRPDMNGEGVQAASRETVRLLDDAITSCARARRDTRDRLALALASDPTCGPAHALDGYFYVNAAAASLFR